ncbi:hypothetical protein VMT65_01635 [Nocardia sp. CDC153]|uniref:hypothetical protein n=1 Tax=Nocardia sp. CDC153 TaxID=3112167 RepID=UPI002DB6BAB3|nr:hypothetical protein [Nocardia sp. CDC153]MEC3951724.1 hypothetical protein [Nocardia sp. CDC153]
MALSVVAEDFRRYGWTVETADEGVELITDERIAAIELTGSVAAGVRRYLRANNLSGPVLEVMGPQRREIHLVVGVAKAARAIESLRAAGAIVHTDGARVPLPGPGRALAWSVMPHEARWVPPVVALAAAVRAVGGFERGLGRVAC